MPHTPTIHNPTNFDPSQYEINGYFDNRPPKHIFGTPTAHFKRMQEQWELEREELFPDHNDHMCQHCHQPHVRFVISATYIPTGENICFGDICVERLNFPNYNKFQAARLRKEAAEKAKEYKRGLERESFLSTRPALRKALDRFNEAPESFSPFTRDVYAKFERWGNMSPAQETAFINSLDYKNRFEQEKERQKQNSRWIGKVGARFSFDNAEVKFTKPTQFGHFTVLEDRSGATVIAFHYLGEKGTKVSFTAKIKAHQERDGVKQTVVNYVKQTDSTDDADLQIGSEQVADIDQAPF